MPGAFRIVLILICLLFSAVTLADESTEKLTVPSREVQRETYKVIRELYEDTLTRQDDKKALIQDILQTAADTKGAASKYALYQLAIEIFPKTNDPELYEKIVDAIDGNFTGADDLWVSGFKTRRFSRDSGIVTHALYGKLIDLSLENHRLDNAMTLARAGIVFIRTRERDLNSDAVERVKRVRAAQDAFKEVEPALKTLEKDPANGEANTTVGRYYCFVLQKWDTGLSYLAKGSDENLQAMALTEQSDPSKAEDQAIIGDAWLEIAEEYPNHKAAIHAHAAGWYEMALPGLKGLQAKKIQKFLADLEPKEIRSRRKEHKIKVLATQRWTETGIVIKKGQRVEIKVDPGAKWKIANPNRMTDFKGGGERGGALMVKVGDYETSFPFDLTGKHGELKLGCYEKIDAWYGDNGGHIEVIVIVR